ncbi:CCA tRNA nucleotidyltransferase [Chloroflexota bacterium]
MDLAEKGQTGFFCRLIEPGVLSLLKKVSNILTVHNVQSYCVGGFVRDVMLERDTADIDIAVASDALEIASLVAASFGGRYVPLDTVNRVGRVVLVNEDVSSRRSREIDFSTFAGSIEQDLARRDFTVDAMAVDLSQLRDDGTAVQFIDPFNGLGDLHQGVIRAVARTAFESDAVRLLRAVRLAGELGFTIESETEALIQHCSNLIASVAGERVREELLRLLAIPGTVKLLPYLDKLALLTSMIPELAQEKGVKQPKEHLWDVFGHSLETVATVDFILRQGTWQYGTEEILAVAPWSAILVQHFDQEVSSGSTRRSLLKLAALLHDVAKPQTKALDAGRVRFLGHADEGASIAVNILQRLRFSAKEIKMVETIVRHHLRPGQMSQDDELPSHRAIYRYFRDLGEAGIDTLFLNLADHLATRGPRLNPGKWQEHSRAIEYVLTQRFEQENLIIPPKLVDGHDLIDTFGIVPGPRIGEFLEAVREAQVSGELTTREEVLSYVDRLLTLPAGTLTLKEEVVGNCKKKVGAS